MNHQKLITRKNKTNIVSNRVNQDQFKFKILNLIILKIYIDKKRMKIHQLKDQPL
jgi:hypothetical protein